VKRHLNIKPFKCEKCQARFARNSTLKIHLNTHNIEQSLNGANVLNGEDAKISYNYDNSKRSKNPDILPLIEKSECEIHKNIFFVNKKSENLENKNNENLEKLKDNSFSNYYENAKKVIEQNDEGEIIFEKEKLNLDNKPVIDDIQNNNICVSLLSYLNHILSITPDIHNSIILIDLSKKLNMNIEWLLAYAEMNLSLSVFQKVNLYLYNHYCNSIIQTISSNINEIYNTSRINNTLNNLNFYSHPINDRIPGISNGSAYNNLNSFDYYNMFNSSMNKIHHNN